MKLFISTGNSRMEKRWNGREIELEEFARRLSGTIRTSESTTQYRKLSKAKQDDIKDVGGFVLGKLKGGRRKKDCVLFRSGLSLDMDYATGDIPEQLEMFFDFRCLIYSTHKHTPENPRLRLVIPLSRNVTADEYMAVARRVAEEIGMELFDDTTYEPSRLMYWPSTSSDGEFVFRDIDGEILNPDTVLSKYKDWRDSSEWPVSSRQQSAVQREMKKRADPLVKDGVIGAFCRTYDMEEAITEFLSEVYQPSAMPGRYDYIPADSQAGVVIYEGKFAYSHHATDPACGKLVNAFDMVRIHKFGELDCHVSEEVDITKLPSFKAMSELAVEDENVKLQLIKEREQSAKLEFQSETEWQSALELDRQGKVKDTLSNIAAIVRYDEKLQPIVFNQLKNMVDVIGELPWRQVKKGWGDADLACAKLYFERVYGIWSPAKFKDALLAVVASERLYHPIKEYFSALTWDGEERLDTLLMEYMGAGDTPYVRAVTRKTLVAAVARIYEPGIKFDSVLVLNGPQGCGKSTFFLKLGREWYSDSLTISDMKDGKTAAEKLQGYWILELGELAGIKKVDVETVKSFVTRNDDKFRQSYGTIVENHPRGCVIVGSTNSEGGFLRDVTGNRRFWPVRVTGKGKFRGWDLTSEIVDQVWAEAIERYHAGEELFLTGDEAQGAYLAQREAVETDDREGLVADYLEHLLPANWDSMDLYQRRSFLGGGEFGNGELTGTVVREKFCLMEVWCECFGKERQNFKKIDSYELESIIQKIGGWKRYDGNANGKLRISGYGVQRAFIRS